MTPRDAVLEALSFRRPAFVPWSIGFTHEAQEKMVARLGRAEFERRTRPHVAFWNGGSFFLPPVGDLHSDSFGVAWDRSADKDIGLNCFNAFQPEVMDVHALLPRYRGRLAFHGGLSTQRTLPYASADEVRAETRRLLAAGAEGGYIFAPAHAVEGDAPVENLIAMFEEIEAQPGAKGLS